jgi:hypothetical protein
MVVIRVAVANQKATDCRGEDVVEVTEVNVVRVPCVEEVLHRERREAPGIGIEVAIHSPGVVEGDRVISELA